MHETTSRTCRICGGVVEKCLDLGRQPVSNSFVPLERTADETFFHLVVGICTSCTMVQQFEEVRRDRMFHQDYPYRPSESAAMRKHFEKQAQRLLETELTGPDAFIVEIGSNDGILLKTISEAGVRHLGVDPSGGAAELAAGKGIRTRVDFFEESTGRAIRAEDGPADVIFSSNTFSHIAYIDSVLRGVVELLGPDGVFVFEDRYLGDIVARTSFDQIYDEHFYLFAGRSVQAMVARFGLEVVDVEHLPVHGGSIRYTAAHAGARRPSAAVRALLEEEETKGLADLATFRTVEARIQQIREDLVALLRRLRAEGRTVVGYGATARSATVTSFCGIGPDLVPYVCDSTPEKQGCVMPGSHIPVRPSTAFADPYPDYALLFAWNHGDEIMAKEREFRQTGGKWILYTPDVHIV